MATYSSNNVIYNRIQRTACHSDLERNTQGSDTSFTDYTPLDVLDLSTRTYNCLRRAGIHTVLNLASLTDEEILNIRQVGIKTLAEIREKLDTYLDEHPMPEQEPPLSEKAMLSEHEVSSSDVDASPSDGQVPVPEDTPIDVLGLSTRAHHALTRGGINTVRQLAQMSSRQIRGIYSIGKKSLTEIEEKLDNYLAEHSLQIDKPVESDSPTPLIDPELQKRAGCAPLDDISIERLGLLGTRQTHLHQADITSIGELTRQTTDIFDKFALLKGRLERYLTWLVEQDETTWADEVAGRGISPLYRVELCETSLDDLISTWLLSSDDIDERDRHVIRWRYGLYGERLTLEEVGNRLGVSRERARQLEKQALNHLDFPQHRAIIRPLMTLLVYLLERAGGLMNEEQIETALKRELVIGDIDPIGVAYLAFEINNDVKWLCGAKAWGVKSIPLKEIGGIQMRLAKILEEEHAPLPTEKVIARFKATRFYRNRQEELEDDFIQACLRVHPEISIDREGQCGLERWDRHRTDEIILALREIGEPVHYTEIAEKTNALLEPEMQTTAHNIHAHMLRMPDIFVRVGHGVYGLAEWGLHDDGSVANAAHRVLSEAGKPLHYDIVAGRVLETWCVNPASVYAALQSDNRFISIGPGVYWLREKIAEGCDDGEADFGDLFGERLEEWQEELNLEENGLDYDTHAEADAIRQMGMDFFK